MTEYQLNTKLLKAWIAFKAGRSQTAPNIGEWDTDHWLCTLDGCSAHIISKKELHLDLSSWGERAQFKCDRFHPRKGQQHTLRYTGRCLETSGKNGRPRLARVYAPADEPDAPTYRIYLDAGKVAEFDGIVRATTASVSPAACAPVYLYDSTDEYAEPCGLVMPLGPKGFEKEREESSNV